MRILVLCLCVTATASGPSIFSRFLSKEAVDGGNQQSTKLMVRGDDQSLQKNPWRSDNWRFESKLTTLAVGSFVAAIGCIVYGHFKVVQGWLLTVNDVRKETPVHILRMIRVLRLTTEQAEQIDSWNDAHKERVEDNKELNDLDFDIKNKAQDHGWNVLARLNSRHWIGKAAFACAFISASTIVTLYIRSILVNPSPTGMEDWRSVPYWYMMHTIFGISLGMLAISAFKAQHMMGGPLYGVVGNVYKHESIHLVGLLSLTYVVFIRGSQSLPNWLIVLSYHSVIALGAVLVHDCIMRKEDAGMMAHHVIAWLVSLSFIHIYRSFPGWYARLDIPRNRIPFSIVFCGCIMMGIGSASYEYAAIFNKNEIFVVGVSLSHVMVAVFLGVYVAPHFRTFRKGDKDAFTFICSLTAAVALIRQIGVMGYLQSKDENVFSNMLTRLGVSKTSWKFKNEKIEEAGFKKLLKSSNPADQRKAKKVIDEIKQFDTRIRLINANEHLLALANGQTFPYMTTATDILKNDNRDNKVAEDLKDQLKDKVHFLGETDEISFRVELSYADYLLVSDGTFPKFEETVGGTSDFILSGIEVAKVLESLEGEVKLSILDRLHKQIDKQFIAKLKTKYPSAIKNLCDEAKKKKLEFNEGLCHKSWLSKISG